MPTARSAVDDENEESEEEGHIPQTVKGRRVVKDRYLRGEYMGKIEKVEKEALSQS